MSERKRKGLPAWIASPTKSAVKVKSCETNNKSIKDFFRPSHNPLDEKALSDVPSDKKEKPTVFIMSPRDRKSVV